MAFKMRGWSAFTKKTDGKGDEFGKGSDYGKNNKNEPQVEKEGDTTPQNQPPGGDQSPENKGSDYLKKRDLDYDPSTRNK